MQTQDHTKASGSRNPISPFSDPEHSYDYLFDTRETAEELMARERRVQRLQRMKKEKARKQLIQKCLIFGLPLLLVLLLLVILLVKCTGSNPEAAPDKNTISKDQSEENTPTQSDPFPQDTAPQTDGPHTTVGDLLNEAMADSRHQVSDADTPPQSTTAQEAHYSAAATDQTQSISGDVVSENALLIDLDTDTILAQRAAKTIISPASMTKVLTVLVAAEHIGEAQLDDTFTITLDITDYSYVNDCSNAGFLENETVTVRDLFYGTILPSGADAALGLAVYVAGSQEAFVELMNEKLAALGLSSTAHMTNCVGLYNENHYCTIYDMAMIMEAAIENELCKEVLGTRIYTTSPTSQHPEGITLSNWFIRRIEDKDTGGQVLGAKTGYVNQSGSCAVSYARDHAGKQYLCVTAHATSSWRCIYDHVAIYKKFATGEPPAAN